MAHLLMHSPDIPAHIREALRDADAEPTRLADAARALHRELAVECSDARELVGLPPGGC